MRPNGEGMRKRLLILPLLLLSLNVTGCATTTATTAQLTPDKTLAQMTAVKTLLTIQNEIVSVRQAIGVPCQKGYIPPQDCTSMDLIYQQAQPAYDAAASAAIVALTSGLPADATTAQQKKDALTELDNNILGIAVKYGVKGATP